MKNKIGVQWLKEIVIGMEEKQRPKNIIGVPEDETSRHMASVKWGEMWNRTNIYNSELIKLSPILN